MRALLEISGLEIQFPFPGHGFRPVVRDVDLTLHPGEIVGLVGESGSGKSQTAAAILGLTPAIARITRGAIRFDARDLLGLSSREWQQVRGRKIALIPQEAFGALNPCLRIATQISESLEIHLGLRQQLARKRALELLETVHIKDAERVARAFPHQLSGGMRQRVTIAIALACDPELLLADEPTSALDAITGRRILDLLAGAAHNRGAALLLITHDLSQARRICGHIAVMYAGQIVEQGPAARVLERPLHPYTRGLLDAALPFKRGAALVPEIPGRAPNPLELPTGCAFHPRCNRAATDCRDRQPQATPAESDRVFRCFHPCESFSKREI